MATKYNGLFDYAANYNVQLAQPLDTRGVCDSVAALLAKDTFGTGGSFAYDGLTVVVPNAGVYYLKDKSKLTAKINATSYVDPVSATDEELLAAGWQKLGDQAASNVNSVNGKTGNVTLAAGDIGITAIEGVEGENIQAALEAINAKASTAYKYKGSKATYEELPAENNTVGDVWNVVAAHGTTPAGTNYAWTGDAWDALGGLVDLSTYQTKAITIDGEPTTVEAAITANKTSAANNTAAINKNKTDIEAVSGSVKGLDTLVKSKQDATVDVSVNGTSYTTIPEAIGALDAYVGEVKAVASTTYKYKGSDTYENIAAKEDPAVGDVWNSTTANGVYPKGTNYAWNGEEWDALGGEVDLSAYQLKSITVGETPTTVEAAINANKTAIDAHVAKQDNPHNVTAAQVGLDKVNNTSDAEKPVSTAQQAALDLKQDKTDNTLATTSKTVVGAINEVKGVADAAAKADASNITVETWKEKLGFITASEVPEQVQPDWNAASGKGQILNKPDVKANNIDTTISGARRFGRCTITNTDPIFRFMNNSTFALARVIAYVGKASTPDAIYTFNVTGSGLEPNHPVICEKITDADLSNFDIVAGSDPEEQRYYAFKNTKTDSENALFVSYEIIIMHNL